MYVFVFINILTYYIYIYSGKISVQVLSGSVDVDIDGDSNTQRNAIMNNDIFEHFKMSESANDFSKQLMSGNKRIK